MRRNSLTRLYTLLALAGCLLVAASRLLAQAVTGTIVGTVTNPTGAVAPNATVSIVLTG